MVEGSKKANEIRDHMISVINNLYSNYKLNQIMPLINLLKMFNNKLDTNNFTEGEMNGNCNGSAYMDVHTKMTYFVNRIHIESAMQVSIKRAMEVFMKFDGIRDNINKLRRERLSSFETKKLFIVALKQILFENKVDEKGVTQTPIDDCNLECNVMSLIKSECNVCSGVLDTQKNNAIDQFCLCKVDVGKRQTLQAITGLLEISVLGFVGHYDSLDIDNIFKGIVLPCADRMSGKRQCKCSGLPKATSLMKSKHDRMVAIVVDKRLMASSKWNNGKVKGLMLEEIFVSHAKEIELQVWESRKEKGMKEKGQYLIAAVSVPLESLLNFQKRENMTINCEPAGQLTFEIRLTMTKVTKDVPEVTRLTEHKIKRTFSIKRKIIEYKHARDLERKECVSTWEKFFKNDLRNLAVAKENNNVNARQAHQSTFCNYSDKCTITKPNSQTNESSVATTQERYINMSPLIYSSKLNNLNPRTVCPFYRSNNEPFFPKKTIAPKYSQSILQEVLQTSKLDDAESVKINSQTVFASPVSKKIVGSNVITSTPIANLFKPTLNCNQTNLNQHSYLFIKGMKTRSNLELSDIDDFEKMAMNVAHSDDEEAKNELQFDGTCREELNIIRIPKLVSNDDSRNIAPSSCTPELQRIPVCKIESGSLSNNDSCRSSTPLPTKNNFHSFHMNESLVSLVRDDSLLDSRLALSTDVSVASDCVLETTKEESVHYEERKLQYDDLDLLCVLGQGHFGKVLLAKYTREPRKNGLCAIKVIYKNRPNNDLDYETLMTERNILMRITSANNPFLVGLIGCFQTERYLIFGIEYACGGDLMGHIHKESFSEATACFYGACIVLALGFLHDNDIMYRDIKLDNLLMDSHGYVKLTDFGLSKENMRWDSTTKTFCGTPEFLAPEIIRELPYTRVVDWWAFGVLLYEMMLAETPFPGDEEHEIFQNILDRQIDEKDLSPEALSLIKRLMQHSPTIRLGSGCNGTQNVMDHIFFRRIDWAALKARTIVAPMVPQLENSIDTQYFEPDFTNRSVHIEHEDDLNDSIIDDNEFFKDFDTFINYDKFVNL